jgi:hypothetical protein
MAPKISPALARDMAYAADPRLLGAVPGHGGFSFLRSGGGPAD